jgi:PTS system mannose-specific IIA component
MRAQIDKGIREIDTGRGVLVLVDMFGGTPSNIALSFLEEGRVEVVTGVNLPMLVKVARQKAEVAIHELAEIARDYGRRNISVASDLLSNREPGKPTT